MTMKAVVISTNQETATVLGMDGIISRIKNNGYNAGDELDIKVLEKAGKGRITSITSRISKNAARIAAAALVMIIGAGSVSVYAMPCSTVTVDINPSLEYKVNLFNRVISVASYNDDGSEILDRIPSKLTNKRLDTVMDMTLDALEEAEYISSETSVVITVDSRFHNEAQIEAGVMDSMNKWNEKKQSEGKNVSVAAETVTITDDMRNKAREMNETPGKVYMDEKLEAEAKAAEEASLQALMDAQAAADVAPTPAVPTAAVTESPNQEESSDSSEDYDSDESSDEAQILAASADTDDSNPTSSPSQSSKSSGNKSQDKKEDKGGKKGGSHNNTEKPAESTEASATDPSAAALPTDGGTASEPVVTVPVDPAVASVLDPAVAAVLDPSAAAVLDPSAAAVLDPSAAAVTDPTAAVAADPLAAALNPAAGTVFDPTAVQPTTEVVPSAAAGTTGIEIPVPMPDGTIAMIPIPEPTLVPEVQPTAIPTEEPVPAAEIVPIVTPVVPEIAVTVPTAVEESPAVTPVPEIQSSSDSSSDDDDDSSSDEKEGDGSSEEQLSQDAASDKSEKQ